MKNKKILLSLLAVIIVVAAVGSGLLYQGRFSPSIEPVDIEPVDIPEEGGDFQGKIVSFDTDANILVVGVHEYTRPDGTTWPEGELTVYYSDDTDITYQGEEPLSEDDFAPLMFIDFDGEFVEGKEGSEVAGVTYISARNLME